MIFKPTVNDIPLERWKAHMLSFSVGACDFSNGYVMPPKASFAIDLTGDIGLRPVAIELDFEGTRYEIAKNVSNLTALLHNGAELFLPDGFYYRCVFSGADAPKEMAPWISRCAFSLYGVRHDALHKDVLTKSDRIFVDGNRNTPVIITLTPSTGAQEMTVNEITVSNINGPVTIDGLAKTVMSGGVNKFVDTNIVSFPVLRPGENDITLSGATEATLSYYPLYV